MAHGNYGNHQQQGYAPSDYQHPQRYNEQALVHNDDHSFGDSESFGRSGLYGRSGYHRYRQDSWIQTEYSGFEILPQRAKKGEKLKWSKSVVTTLPFSSKDLERETKQRRRKYPLMRSFNMLSRSQRGEVSRIVEEQKEREPDPNAEWALADVRLKYESSMWTGTYVKAIIVVVTRADKFNERHDGLTGNGIYPREQLFDPRIGMNDRHRRNDGRWDTSEYDPLRRALRPDYQQQQQVDAVEWQGSYPYPDHRAANVKHPQQHQDNRTELPDHHWNPRTDEANQYTPNQYNATTYQQNEHHANVSPGEYEDSFFEDACQDADGYDVGRPSGPRHPQCVQRRSRRDDELSALEHAVKDMRRATRAGHYHGSESQPSVDRNSIFSHGDDRRPLTPPSTPPDSAFWPVNGCRQRHSDDTRSQSSDDWRGDVEIRPNRRGRQFSSWSRELSPLVMKRRHSDDPQWHQVGRDRYNDDQWQGGARSDVEGRWGQSGEREGQGREHR